MTKGQPVKLVYTFQIETVIEIDSDKYQIVKNMEPTVIVHALLNNGVLEEMHRANEPIEAGNITPIKLELFTNGLDYHPEYMITIEPA